MRTKLVRDYMMPLQGNCNKTKTRNQTKGSHLTCEKARKMFCIVYLFAMDYENKIVFSRESGYFYNEMSYGKLFIRKKTDNFWFCEYNLLRQIWKGTCFTANWYISLEWQKPRDAISQMETYLDINFTVHYRNTGTKLNFFQWKYQFRR